MNKFIFAFVAFLAIAQAKPYGGSQYAGPSLAYQAVPVQSSYSALPSYGSQSSYGAPLSYAVPSVQLQPIALPYSTSNYGGYVAPSPLVAAPSNPSASAAAAASASQLNAGNYGQLVVPSYEIVSGIPASPVYGGSYGPSVSY